MIMKLHLINAALPFLTLNKELFVSQCNLHRICNTQLFIFDLALDNNLTPFLLECLDLLSLK